MGVAGAYPGQPLKLANRDQTVCRRCQSMASWRRAEANRFETMRQLTSPLAKVALAPALDSYSIRHRDALALDQSDFVTFVDISITVATDTDRGWCCCYCNTM